MLVLASCWVFLLRLLSSTAGAVPQASMMLPTDVTTDGFDSVSTILPVIGVLTQERGPANPNVTYFPASYSKYVEMAGARVVPVLCDQSKKELADLYGKLNGLIVPGAAL